MIKPRLAPVVAPTMLWGCRSPKAKTTYVASTPLLAYWCWLQRLQTPTREGFLEKCAMLDRLRASL